MKINFITPSLSRKRFSGGIYCILKHADELTKLGHTVNIIPLYGGKQPQWINCSANFLINNKPDCIEKKKLKCWLSKLSRITYGLRSNIQKKAIQEEHIAGAIPDADITIATAWQTAIPVYKYGKGIKAYFMQHFEPFFIEDDDDFDRFLCETTYYLPLKKIANSSWLQKHIRIFLKNSDKEQEILKSTNAIDLDKFKKLDIKITRKNKKHIKVISYSGRGVKWKGFTEMSQAMSIARKTLPDWEIEWLVYGCNADTSEFDTEYTDLGFLQTEQLVEAYNSADILLSASWYESFPLFPIEAMACKLPTITTPKGTEDYAINNETAVVVEEKNPQSIANGLIKLISDETYRNKIAEQGYIQSQRFGWKQAGKNMEKTLLNLLNNH